ncbi:MAG: Dihydroorotate dehydrogenase 2 [Parcubacteria group bacterium GW2011_GWB1_48_6]|nr:MAG: Dihydroorotate dehydrogenase 2 [Parcubacteria group bacterium GW2011_GWB1_48_6]
MEKKYKWLLKPIFFRMDPENIHDIMSALLRVAGKFLIIRKIAYLFWGYSHPALRQDILGIKFQNPVGLSAGFDKDATLIDIMPSLGFGFTEVGSITGEPCEGNPKPRLWRLKKSKSLVVYYGLKNEGCEAVASKLKGQKFPLPVGISIAKTNSKETVTDDSAIADYFKTYREFAGIGDYATINISCPNAFGGQPFTDSGKLQKLLEKIFSIPKTKPIFLKLSPDLNHEEIDKILEVADKFPIDGFVCTNLTKNRDKDLNKNLLDENIPAQGGISGKVVGQLSDDLIRYVCQKTKNNPKKPLIIGVGGVSSAEDAYSKIKAGASLVELITGMIFEGPQLISDINMGLVRLLKADGYKNISEAVGKE